MLNDAEMIQATLSLADWQERTERARFHHMRAEESRILRGVSLKAGVTAGGEPLAIRDDRAAAVRCQSEALADLGRAIDAVSRMALQTEPKHSAIEAKLNGLLRETLRDYVALQELAGREQVAEITRALWPLQILDGAEPRALAAKLALEARAE